VQALENLQREGMQANATIGPRVDKVYKLVYNACETLSTSLATTLQAAGEDSMGTGEHNVVRIKVSR
jgi:hypothetical protein